MGFAEKAMHLAKERVGEHPNREGSGFGLGLWQVYSFKGTHPACPGEYLFSTIMMWSHFIMVTPKIFQRRKMGLVSPRRPFPEQGCEDLRDQNKRMAGLRKALLTVSFCDWEDNTELLSSSTTPAPIWQSLASSPSHPRMHCTPSESGV